MLFKKTLRIVRKTKLPPWLPLLKASMFANILGVMVCLEGTLPKL